MTAQALHPTLWRTCRALANRKRLQLFGLLLQQPDQTVSELSVRLKISLPATSQYLRILDARGFIQPRRAGGCVYYRTHSEMSLEPAHTLGKALRLTFQQDPNPVDTIFKLATAFTHPRRIALYRALHAQKQRFEPLRAVTRFSSHALSRHLAKLIARGFVARQDGNYLALEPEDHFGRALARLVNGVQSG